MSSITEDGSAGWVDEKPFYIEGRAWDISKKQYLLEVWQKNIGIKIALERLIGIRMSVPEEAQIVGALRAALIAPEALKQS